jgi:hypothetical protein
MVKKVLSRLTIVAMLTFLGCTNSTIDSVTLIDEIGEETTGNVKIPKFIDLSKMNYLISEHNIKVSMTLEELPKELTYNKSEENSPEYMWEVFFDIDNNQKKSKGDISFAVSYFVHSPNSKIIVNTKPILSFTQQNIWEINEKGGAVYSGNLLEYTYIEGNTLTFDVPKKLFKFLRNITSSTKLSFTASCIIEDKKYEDSYPN